MSAKIDCAKGQQKIARLKINNALNQRLVEQILVIMGELAQPGPTERPEIDLSQFLIALSQFDFSKYDPFDVGALFKVIGESISDGLMAAAHGYGE